MATYSQTNGEAETNRTTEPVGGSSRIGETARSSEWENRDQVGRGIESTKQDVKQNYEMVKQTASEYADKGEAILREQVERAPMQTVAIAVGIGFIAGLLLRRS